MVKKLKSWQKPKFFCKKFLPFAKKSYLRIRNKIINIKY